MFKNYFIIALRNLNKHRIYSFFNIFGLALGVACFTLIFSYVKLESSYETSYPKSDRIYRLTYLEKGANANRHYAITSPLFGPMLQAQIPEVELVTRIMGSDPQVLQISNDNKEVKNFTVEHGFNVDSTLFEMFDISFLIGNPSQVFSVMESIILSEDLAYKMFGNKNPIGKIVHFPTQKKDLVVTGVFENFPSNSHIQMNYCMPFELAYADMKGTRLYNFYMSRKMRSVYTYILLSDKSAINRLEEKMPSFLQSYYAEYDKPEIISEKYASPLQPIHNIHLHSNLEREMSKNSSVENVYIYSIIGFLILFIACINYINISTVLILKRNKELGIRKIIGASKNQIILQYYTESGLFVFIAVVFSVLCTDIVLPYFNQISGNEFQISDIYSISNIIAVVLIAIIVSFISALYPIYVAHNINLKGTISTFLKKGSYSDRFRRVLISFQFIISVILIFCTLVIYMQLKLFSEKDLGFDKKNLLQVEVSSYFIGRLHSSDLSFKAELLKNPYILSVTFCSGHPGDQLKIVSLLTNTNEENEYRTIFVDEDYLKTMKIKLIEGEGFKYNSAGTTQYMLTEKGKQTAGYLNPIGETINIKPWGMGKIVGIVKDFDYSSLHDKIDPLVLICPKMVISEKILVRYQGDYNEVAEYIQEKVKEIHPVSAYTMNISTVEMKLESLYAVEFRVGKTIKALTIIAIIISCIGLFGLSAFTAEIRLKEMGIRKIHGASLINIAKVFSLDFLKMIVLSSLIAIPIAWWAMDLWLQNFAYRIQISWIHVLVSMFSIVLVSLITILYQMIKVAKTNPVDYIKYE